MTTPRVLLCLALACPAAASAQPMRAGGYEQQYGGFGNVLHDLRLGLPVTPYLGLGAGYQEVELDHINSSSFDAVVGHSSPIARATSPIRASPALPFPCRCAASA